MKRRTVLKKLVYVVPTILTLPAVAAFASRGSGKATWIERDSRRWVPTKRRPA